MGYPVLSREDSVIYGNGPYPEYGIPDGFCEEAKDMMWHLGYRIIEKDAELHLIDGEEAVMVFGSWDDLEEWLVAEYWSSADAGLIV